MLWVKCSSLFGLIVNDEEKRFYSIDNSAVEIVFVIVDLANKLECFVTCMFFLVNFRLGYETSTSVPFTMVVLPANLRLSRKGTNTLAYFTTTSVTERKKVL